MDLKDLVECYNDNLKLFIDKHCPPATKSFHQRPYSRWYNEKLQNKKRKTRAAERKKNKSGSLEDLANYKREKNGYNWMQKITRSDYYKGEIENCGNDYKAIQ